MIADTVAILLMTGGAGLLGARLLARMSSSWTDHLERGLFSLGVGLAVYAMVITLAGFLGGLYTCTAYGLIGLSFLAGRRYLKRVWERRSSFQMPEITPWMAIPSIALILGLTVSYIASTAPLSGSAGSDAVAYQIGGPRVYAAYHRLIPIPTNVRTYMPSYQNMLYTFAILLKSVETAKLLNFVFGMGLIGVTVYLCRRFIGKDIAPLAGLICFAHPVFILNISDAYIGLGLSFFFMLGVIALLRWYETGDIKWLVLSALCCGFNIGSTYIGVIYLASMTPLFLMRLRSWTLRPILLFGGVIFLVAVPWYIKNWILTGNPLFPFLAQGVTDPYLLMATQITRDAHDFPRGGFLNMLAFPWNLLIHGDYYHFWAGFGHLYFIFTPLFLLGVRRYGRSVLFLYFTFLFFIVVWFYAGNHAIRYLVPITPLLALIVAAAFRTLTPYNLTRLAGLGTISLAILFGAVTLRKESQAQMAYLRLSKQDFLTERVYYYPGCLFLNRLDRESTIVYLCGRVFPVYFDVRTIGPNYTAYEADSDIRTSDDEQWLGVGLEKLQTLGVTHVMDVSGKFLAYRQRLGDAERFRLVFERDDTQVFEALYSTSR